MYFICAIISSILASELEVALSFKKYEKKIGETNEFSELKKNASNYSIKDLEKECLYIVGLYSFDNEPKQNTETPVDNSIKFSATHDNGEVEDPIEATYKKYLNK